MKRRGFLKVLGGGTILAAGGAAAFGLTRTPRAALKPWGAAPAYADPRKRILAHALLAPNPHNRQPWLVELRGDDTVILHRDETRDLLMTDPYHRQIFIGLGCFTEQMVIAASAERLHADLTLFPEGDDGPIFAATFREGAKPDVLAAHILARRSCKAPYAPRTPETATLEPLARNADIITDPPTVTRLKNLTFDALMVEIETPRTLRESVELMRIGKAEINANPDGIDLRSPILDALRQVGVLTEAMLMDTHHAAFRQQMDTYRTMMMATPAYAVVRTNGNTRRDQIAAGRRWLRLNLEATAQGLALHPVSQALQEYPEVADHYRSAHDLLANPGETVQMLGRLGYGPDAPATPRWGLEARLLNG